MKKIIFFLLTYALCGSRLIVVAQNVGIGIASPVFKLDVRNGSINTDSVYRIGTTTVLSVAGGANLLVGINAGRVNTGNNNTFSGHQAGFSNSTGTYNSFFGSAAGNFNTTGFSNSFFGAVSGFFNNNGSNNSFFGYDAGASNTSGARNSFFGQDAGVSNTLGTLAKRRLRMMKRNASNPICPLPMCS